MLVEVGKQSFDVVIVQHNQASTTTTSFVHSTKELRYTSYVTEIMGARVDQDKDCDVATESIGRRGCDGKVRRGCDPLTREVQSYHVRVMSALVRCRCRGVREQRCVEMRGGACPRRCGVVL